MAFGPGDIDPRGRTVVEIQRLLGVERQIHSMTAGLTRLRAAGKLSAAEFTKFNSVLGSYTGTGQQATDQAMAFEKAIGRGGYSMNMFGEAIGRAALKVTFWMIATTAVIGVMRKVQDTIKLWKDLEIALERIGITTSTVGDKLYTFFERTSDVAIAMGMPIEQVQGGMDLALRATAEYEDQTRRAVVATTLLRDAAILGNVAGMQFSQSIDVLVGSLRQTGMSLSQGIELLDKWVAVSKQAAVSVNDLSQGFAIMSSAAATAGLNVDQVNGLIAALSEAVTLGPVQVGNAIRALMSTLYNEGSIKQLSRIGISVRDTTGEFRSFWDILNELSAMEVTGALTEKQILEIARAAGAGQRRYAQFVALLKNWDAAVRVSTISANAQGEALEANERIINTLTNAWDQFTAAQNKMFYAVGEKSGIIEDMADTFRLLASGLQWVSSMSESFAMFAKVIAKVTAAFIAMKVALLAINALKMAPWLTGVGVRLRQMGGMAPFTMAGLGAVRGRDDRWYAGRDIASYPTTGQPIAKGQPLPTAVAPLPAGGLGTAKLAWSNMGKSIAKGMIKPMGGVGVVFGIFAGQAIASQLYESDWSRLGGGIGGAIGAVLGGVAGMAAGSVIGGAIAQIIENTATPLAERVEKHLNRWLASLPVSMRTAIDKLRKETATLVDIPEYSDFLIDAMKKWDDSIVDSIHELDHTARMMTMSKFIPEGVFVEKIKDWGGRHEAAKEEIALLRFAREEAERLADVQEYTVDLTMKIAQSAKAITDEYNLQEAVDSEIAKIEAQILDLTAEQYQERMSGVYAAGTTFPKLLAQLREFAPELADTFKLDYPSFEDFLAVDADAFSPLQMALGTIEDSLKNIDELEDAIAQGAKVIGMSYEDVTAEALQAYYDELTKVLELQDKGILPDLSSFYDMYELTGKTIEEKDIEVRNILDMILVDIVAALEAQTELTNETYKYQEALAALPRYYQAIGDWVPKGQMATFEVGTNLGQVQSMIDRLTEVLHPEKWFGSSEQIYHAFLKTAQDSISGYWQTFKTYPEVWQAMLGELEGIEKNTAAALEAEYNIPEWYATPTRYWAMKSTGTREFGPAQERLWHMWLEFVADQDEALADMNNTLTGTDDASAPAAAGLNQVNDALNNIAEIAPEAAGYLWEFTTPEAVDSFGEALDEVATDAANATGVVLTAGETFRAWLYDLAASFINAIPGVNIMPRIPEGVLGSRQHGGAIPETGSYLLHKGEFVTPNTDFKDTNSILSNSYQSLLMSQNYLSAINIGISGLRNEIKMLREQVGQSNTGDTEFRKVTRASYTPLNSLGARRV